MRIHIGIGNFEILTVAPDMARSIMVAEMTVLQFVSLNLHLNLNFEENPHLNMEIASNVSGNSMVIYVWL